MRVVAILRGAGDALGRQFGPAATDLLYEALDDAEREILRSFGGAGAVPADGDASGGEEDDDDDGHAGDDDNAATPRR